jgi:signal peptidase
MSKVLKGIYVLFKVAILGFIFLLATSICIQRFSNNAVSIFNYRLFGVVTGSMAPKYNIGDVLLCKEVDPKTLKVGDDISYLGKTGSMKNKVVTHRIIEISKDEIVISNSGKETSLNEKLIFNYFYKESKEKNSTGLGLVLIKTICKKHNLDIDYQFVEKKHRFIITKK